MIKLQIPAGKATPAPPVGPALGQAGVAIMDFCKAFNAKTAKDEGLIIPVVITVYADRSYTFITKTPPVAVLIKREAGIAKGSGEPNRNKVGTHHDEAGRGDRQDRRCRTSTPTICRQRSRPSRAPPAAWAWRSPASAGCVGPGPTTGPGHELGDGRGRRRWERRDSEPGAKGA